MKKIFVLLMTVIMIMSLAACNGEQTPDKPDDTTSDVSSTETNSDESSPEISEAEESTPVKTSAWVTKTDLKTPDFGAPQKVTDEVRFETGDTFYTMNLYKAHWSDINPEELKRELQTLLVRRLDMAH